MGIKLSKRDEKSVDSFSLFHFFMRKPPFDVVMLILLDVLQFFLPILSFSHLNMVRYHGVPICPAHRDEIAGICRSGR